MFFLGFYVRTAIVRVRVRVGIGVVVLAFVSNASEIQLKEIVFVFVREFFIFVDVLRQFGFPLSFFYFH